MDEYLILLYSLIFGGGSGGSGGDGVKIYTTMAEMAAVVKNGVIASCIEATYKGAWQCDTSLPSDPATGYWHKITGTNDINITDELLENTWNVDNLDIDEDSTSLIKVGSRYVLNTKFSFKIPQTDLLNEELKIMELPHATKEVHGFCDITTAGGILTCEYNRHLFYDSDGSKYINPASFANKKILIQSIANVRGIETDHPTAYQRVNQSNYNLMEKDNMPVFDIVLHYIDSTGSVEDEEHLHPAQDSYRLHLPRTIYSTDKILVEDIGSESAGTRCKGYERVPAYLVDKVEPKTNAEYLYKKELYLKGCNVNAQGQLCKWIFVRSVDSIDFLPEDQIGFDGEVTSEVIQYDSDKRQESFTIHDGAIYLRKGISFVDATIFTVY